MGRTTPQFPAEQPFDLLNGVSAAAYSEKEHGGGPPREREGRA